MRHRIVQLPQKYERVLSIDEYDISYTDILKHKIDTGPHRHVREALRRKPIANQPFIDESVDKMLAAGIIEIRHAKRMGLKCMHRRKEMWLPQIRNRCPQGQQNFQGRFISATTH